MNLELLEISNGDRLAALMVLDPLEKHRHTRVLTNKIIPDVFGSGKNIFRIINMFLNLGQLLIKDKLGRVVRWVPFPHF